jgi:DNA-binding CsgD family transcriptional regulator
LAHQARIELSAAGEEALARCQWAEAKALFEAALREAPDDPHALAGLGLALFWVGEERAAREAKEQAYVGYRRLGDAQRAAAAAIYVSSDYRMSGENAAAAAGWLARAERCLEAVGACAERGWIEIERAKSASEPHVSERHARRAVELARELQDPDLEVSALAHVGTALVRTGRWEDGMALLDEAMAGALGGEASDAFAIGDACCQTLSSCDQIADLRRASEWCRVVLEFAERHNYTPLYAWCRAIYAGVLIATGEWRRAESELLDSMRTYDTFGGLGSRVHALARLAELRLRQGRIEEAERLLADCEEHPLALVSVARLRLFRGAAGAAAAMVERRLAALSAGAPGSAPLFPVLVEAHLAQGELDAAAATARRFHRLANRLRRDNLRGLAHLASAEVALAAGGNAVPDLEAALELFGRLGMPFEEGEARLRLARVFAAAAGGSVLAVDEARRALTRFERLGAARRVDEAAALLRSLGAEGRTATRNGGDLTSREREVLALLAEGLSNAEIADRLVISRKTAGHHVSHIFRKLGLRNRAEAAAYALHERTRQESTP